jgi:hypothetical protein
MANKCLTVVVSILYLPFHMGLLAFDGIKAALGKE